MKIKVEKRDLLSLISKAQNIVEKKSTMPILVNALLETEGDQLRVFATNLEVSLTDRAQAEVVEPGKVAVNARNLFDIVKELPDGPVFLEKRENNWLKITREKSVFNLVGVSPEEYPVFPVVETQAVMKIDADILSEMIEKTIYSVANDETRYHLNGVFFARQKGEGGPRFRMVATDGHRLSLVDRKTTDGVDFGDDVEKGVIIPRKGLQEIRKLLESAEDSVSMVIEGSQLVVTHGSTVLMVRLIEGRYPDYKQLIPQNMTEHVYIDRESLLSSLKRVSLLSNQKSKGVTMAFSPGRVEITSNNPDLGDAKEELEVDYNGKEMKIGFNARYILDVLGAMNEPEVGIELKDQLSPGLVRPKEDKDYTCVIMPMRI